MKKIAFFGTPAFAATTLEVLLSGSSNKNFEVSLVFCQPDRKSGRGQRLVPPPVKMLAQKHGIPVYQPASLLKRTEDGAQAYAALLEAKVDLGVVVAYGKIIPKRWLHVPTHDLINIHASLLPRWRGAAPIQRAIEAGDKKTGICLMEVGPGMDEGGIFAKTETPIQDHETSGTLFERMAQLGADLLMANIEALLEGNLPAKSQASQGITHAAMITKEEAQIQWGKSALTICRHVRAMTPNPGAYTFLNGNRVKLAQPTLPQHPLSEGIKPATSVPVGSILSTSPLTVQTGEGSLEFASIQLPGKKPGPCPENLDGAQFESV